MGYSSSAAGLLHQHSGWRSVQENLPGKTNCYYSPFREFTRVSLLFVVLFELTFRLRGREIRRSPGLSISAVELLSFFNNSESTSELRKAREAAPVRPISDPRELQTS